MDSSEDAFSSSSFFLFSASSLALAAATSGFSFRLRASAYL